jgi:hypothetical protein
MSRRPLLLCRGAILLAACRAAPAFNSPCRRSQTLRRDAALVSRPKQATRPRVLLWVLRINLVVGRLLPVFPWKRRAGRHVSKAVPFSDSCSAVMPNLLAAPTTDLPYDGIAPFIPSGALRLRSYNWPTARLAVLQNGCTARARLCRDVWQSHCVHDL